jgi:ABC-2 type transport system permease protein
MNQESGHYLLSCLWPPARFWFTQKSFNLSYLSSSVSPVIVGVVENLSFLTHYEAVIRGVVEFKDVAYFGILIAAWVYACTLILEERKAC